MNEERASLYYAAWWRRVLGVTIDGLVFCPLLIIQFKFGRMSPRLYVASLILLGISGLAYRAYCHGRWGRTVGKYVMGTRVAGIDGSHITWRQAFLRIAVDIAIGIIGWFAIIPAYLQVPLEGYTALELRERYEIVRGFWPAWYPRFMKVQQGWIWSAFALLLLNRKRRTWHDFIAGTVVLQKQPTRRQAKAEDPYAFDGAKEMKRLRKL